MNGHPSDGFGFTLIGNEIVGVADFLEVNGLRGSRVHNAANTTGPGELHSVVDGAQRDLKLQDDSVRFVQQQSRGVHIFRGEYVVGALHDDDAVLAARIYEDGRHSAGNSFGEEHIPRVDPLRFKVLDCGGAEEIVPHSRHHAHVCSAEPRRNRLIGAFAAKAEIELFAEDGLPGPREHIIKRSEVYIGAAHYRNKGLLGHHFITVVSGKIIRYFGLALSSKNISNHKPQIRRPFRQTAYEPRIPVVAVSDKHDGGTPLARETFLFRALDAVEHLHLEILFRKSFRGCETGQAVDQRDVMGAKSGAHATILFFGAQHLLPKPEITFINVLLARKGDFRRFVVSPFDQANRRPQRQELRQ